MASLTLALVGCWPELAKHQAEYQYPFVITTLIFIFFTFLLLKSFSSVKLNLPPSPPKLPILGNLHQLGPLLHQIFHNLSQKYGPFMYLRLGYSDVLVVSSAEMAREIKTTHEIPFGNRPSTTSSRILFYGGKDIAFAPYGDYWKQVRKIVVLEVLTNKKVGSFKSVRKEEVALMINKISNSAKSTPIPVNITETVVNVVNDIISRCAFGRKPGAQDGEKNFSEIPNTLMSLVRAFSFGDLFPFLAWMDVLSGLIGRMKKVSVELDTFFDQIIDEHIIQNKQGGGPAAGSNNDFVDTLLQVQKDNIDFTRENIKALLLDVFVGGTDTTSSTIVWTMAELVNNPNVMQKVQEEVRRVVGKKNLVEEEDIQQMEFLKDVIKESLRLHPPAALLSMATSTITNVNGYHVPAKTKVFINMWSIHRDPKLWERPEEFHPERFSKSHINFSGQDFKYIPFGSGRRICPGISFGTMVAELVIANLLYWFDWETPGGEKLDMSESLGLALTKKLPIHLIPIPISPFP